MPMTAAERSGAACTPVDDTAVRTVLPATLLAVTLTLIHLPFASSGTSNSGSTASITVVQLVAGAVVQMAHA